MTAAEAQRLVHGTSVSWVTESIAPSGAGNPGRNPEPPRSGRDSRADDVTLHHHVPGRLSAPTCPSSKNRRFCTGAAGCKRTTAASRKGRTEMTGAAPWHAPPSLDFPAWGPTAS